MMDKETEELVKKVRKELQTLRARVDKLQNYAALKACEELDSALN